MTKPIQRLLDRYSELSIEQKATQERLEAIKAEMATIATELGAERSGGTRPVRIGSTSSDAGKSAYIPTPAEQKVIDFVLSRTETRAKDLQEALGLSASLANQRLSELSREPKELIDKIGYGVYGILKKGE